MPDSPVSARFARQIALPGFGEAGQRALGDARVLVVGAGGLGSIAIPSLAGAGVGTIGIVDDDTVETSNLHRQLVHATADIGRSKVDSAADRVAAIAPDVTVVRHAVRLSSANALEILAEYDLVLDGSDNFPTRYLASDAAALADIPLVWGAVSQFGGQVGVSWSSRGPHYRDLFPTPPPPGSVLSCAEGGVLPTTVAVIGSLMATEAIKLLTGIGRPLIGRVTVFDGLTGGFRELSYERDPEAAPITQLIDYELFCGLPSAGGGPEEGSPWPSTSVTPEELAEVLSGSLPRAGAVGGATDGNWAQGGVTLLDVREPWEAEIATLPGARLVPLGELPTAVDSIDTTRPVVVFCHSGIRSARALELLLERGVEARHLDGGIDAWSRRIDPSIPRY
jgi:adenylyltransferase/sulfurtransferase